MFRTLEPSQGIKLYLLLTFPFLCRLCWISGDHSGREESADLSHFYSAAGTSQIADLDDFGRLVLSINEEQESFDEWTEEDDFS